MDQQQGIDANDFQVNPGYVQGQLAKALTTCEEHRDPEVRELARKRVAKWIRAFEGLVNGTHAVGSRTPISGVPAWATLEVVTGGFVTGNLLAGGDLQDHERRLLTELSISTADKERQTLNRYFVSETGMSRLRELLSSGRYEIDVPEEGALLVAAWLLDSGHAEAARELLEELGPFFGKLRFYPIPVEQPRRFGSRLCLQDVGTTIGSLSRISPNQRILAQKEAIEVWAPLLDRTVELFLETVQGEPPYFAADGENTPTVEGGWPCRTFPDGWQDRARTLLEEYQSKRGVHMLCGKPDRKKENFPQLRMWLARCIDNADSLSERDLARIRLLLARSVRRRGVPQSPRWLELRARQAEQVRGPTHQEVSQVVVSRLEQHPHDSGVEEMESLIQPVTEPESGRFKIDASAEIPKSVIRKVQRCLIDTADALVARGVITSGETLARVLPQVTSGLRAAGIADPALRQLYASIYRAFRRRRSLLLLNLESQVRIEELPWVAAIEQFRRDDLSTRELSKETLQEIVALTLISFPHAIIPNKLLQELRALAKGAELNLPLVDEVAADIFMGEFSARFVHAAKQAADLLAGSLYETYFGIDYASVRRVPEPQPRERRSWYRRGLTENKFVELCASRAGIESGGWSVARNGMIIEQQQILTTQNLAVLFSGLDLTEELRGHLDSMARDCFAWIVARQQASAPTHHALLIMLKNTAYAWRQMIFYLALLPQHQVQDFLTWADDHLAEQKPEFQQRFRPALTGLQLAAEGKSIDESETARRFLGWTRERHWLLGPKPTGRDA